MIKHKTLETVSSINDLDLYKCIPFEYIPHFYAVGHFSKLGESVTDEPTIINGNKNQQDYSIKGFLIHIGYDTKGNKILISDRVVDSYVSLTTLHMNGNLYGNAYIDWYDYSQISPTAVELKNNSSKYTITSSESNSSYTALQSYTNSEYQFYSRHDNPEHFIKIKFNDGPVSVDAFSYTYASYTTSSIPHTIYLEGSNDDSQFDILFEFNSNNFNRIKNNYYYYLNERFKLNKKYNYSIYKLRGLVRPGDTCAIDKFKLFNSSGSPSSDFDNYNLRVSLLDLNQYRKLFTSDTFNDTVFLKEDKSKIMNISNNNYIEPTSSHRSARSMYNYSPYNLNREDSDYRTSQGLYYRPLVICEPKQQGYISNALLSESFLASMSGSVDIKLELSNGYPLPAEYSVFINNEEIKSLKNEISNPKIDLSIEKKLFKKDDNILNIIIKSKNNGFIKTFNYRFSVEISKDNTRHNREFNYTDQWLSPGVTKDDNNGYTLKETNSDTDLKFTVETKNRATVKSIKVNDSISKPIRGSLFLNKTSEKLIDDNSKMYSYKLIGDNIPKINIREVKN